MLSRPAAAANLAGPILITGSHRSGTTWVARMLAASPRLRYVFEPFNLEMHHACPCGARLEHWFQYIRRGSDGNAACRTHLEHMIHPPSVPRTLLDGLERRRRPTDRPLVQDPVALLAAEWMARRFGMSVVVMIRHPAAFAAGLKRLKWPFAFKALLDQPALMHDRLAPFRAEMESFCERPRDLVDQAALAWKVFYSIVLGYRERVKGGARLDDAGITGHSDWLFVRHEDLAADPVAGFASMYQRFGLRFDARARRVVIANSEESNPVMRRGPHDVRRNSRALAWAWKRRLDKDEIRRVRARVEEVSCRFYDDSDWQAPARTREPQREAL